MCSTANHLKTRIPRTVFQEREILEDIWLHGNKAVIADAQELLLRVRCEDYNVPYEEAPPDETSGMRQTRYE